MERYARWLASKEEGAKHKLYTAIADNLATGKPAVAPNAPERPQGPDWPEMHRYRPRGRYDDEKSAP
jgi:hypothetical protein